MSDHSSGFRKAFTTAFPSVQFGQCWPHIIRKWKEGEYASKQWEHFDLVTEHLHSIHMAATAKMRDLLMKTYGEIWDSWNQGKTMRTFWNSYCVDGWDNWSYGTRSLYYGVFDVYLRVFACAYRPQVCSHASYAPQTRTHRRYGTDRSCYPESQACSKAAQLIASMRPSLNSFRWMPSSSQAL